MVKIFYIMFLCAFFFLRSGDLFASCMIDLPPLNTRVRDADAIFTGFLKSDGKIASDGEIDSEAFVSVNRVFKGELGAFAIILHVSGSPGDCIDNTLRFDPESKEEMIFFVKKRGDKFFSTSSMGTESVELGRVRLEIPQIPGVVLEEKAKAEKEANRPWWNKFGWFD